jgi:hypothetical protein
MKLTRAPDDLEVTQIRHTSEYDPGYKLIRARIEREIQQTMRDLRTADTWEKTQKLQARCEAYEMVLMLPRMLLDEYKRK